MEGTESNFCILKDDPFTKLYSKKEEHKILFLPVDHAEAEGEMLLPPPNEDREHLAMIPTIPCCLALAKLQYLFIFSVVGVWALKELDWEKCSYIQTLAPTQYL